MLAVQVIHFIYMVCSIDVDKIVDFLFEYGWHKQSKDKIKQYVVEHLAYRTMFVLWQEEEIVAVVRWNVEGSTAHILDLVTSPSHRNISTMKWIIKNMVSKGITWFPWVRYLSWEREAKYPDRDRKTYSVEKLLKGEKNEYQNISAITANC